MFEVFIKKSVFFIALSHLFIISPAISQNDKDVIVIYETISVEEEDSLSYEDRRKQAYEHFFDPIKKAKESTRIQSYLGLRGLSYLPENPTYREKFNGIKDLDSLTYLSIRNYGFEEFPLFVTELDKLENLIIEDAKFTNIPDEIENLSGLKELKISANLQDLPSTMMNFKSLEKVSLNGNKFDNVPEVIKEWTSLKRLKINSNGLEAIPSGITFPESLKGIELSYNKFETFPEALFDATGLVSINLSGNPIKTVDVRISKLSANLKQLILQKTPLTESQIRQLEELLPNTKIYF